MDGHMKLARWGFETQGCINGYSRLVTFLECSTNNKASTVLQSVQATLSYGVPSRVRSDYGGENFEVAVFMNMVRWEDRGSHLTGESVHNQRIERLWRDVNTEVIDPIYNMFYEMEDDGLLHMEDSSHICALHILFTEEINDRLSTFKDAWNKHKLSSAHNKTPEQLWLQGMTNNATRDVVEEDVAKTVEDALERYGLSVEQFPGVGGKDNILPPTSVSIRQYHLQTTQEQVDELRRMINVRLQ